MVKSDETNLADDEDKGQPSNLANQAQEVDENLTTRMLAKNFNVDHSTIVRRLKKVGKVWNLAVWVSYELSDNNFIVSVE